MRALGDDARQALREYGCGLVVRSYGAYIRSLQTKPVLRTAPNATHRLSWFDPITILLPPGRYWMKAYQPLLWRLETHAATAVVDVRPGHITDLRYYYMRYSGALKPLNFVPVR